MFMMWSTVSFLLLFISLGAFFWVSHFLLASWILLELLTWGVFFYFSKTWGGGSKKDLFTFFITQSGASLVWLFSSFLLQTWEESWKSGVEGELDFSPYLKVLILSALFLKMSFFPNHLWGWQIYNSGSLQPILLMSTILKLMPMMLISTIILSSSSMEMLLVFLGGNVLVTLWGVWSVGSLFGFLFLSGVLQYSLMMLLMSIQDFSYAGSYMISYWWMSFVFFSFLEFYKYESFNPYDFWSMKTSPLSMFWFLFLGGFPPSLMFFLKLGMFSKMEGLTEHPLFLVLIFSIFLYMFFFLFSILRDFFGGQNQEMLFTGSSLYSQVPHSIHSFLNFIFTFLKGVWSFLMFSMFTVWYFS